MKIELLFNNMTVLQGDLIKLLECAMGMHIKPGTHITIRASNEQMTIQDSYTLVRCDGDHFGDPCGDPECWLRE